MKHKGLWLLAPPLIGVVLVWRAGEQQREQRDVPNRACEATLRAIFADELPNASRVFVSVDGHDPSPSFLASFDGFRTTVLPASASGPVPQVIGRVGPDSRLSMQCRVRPSAAFVDVQGLWGHGAIVYSLRLQDGQWKVFGVTST